MIDLHMHSIFSDGSYTPEQLLDEAERGGLSAIALTDHDTMAGLPRFAKAAVGRSVKAIPGVEVSAEFGEATMHMLGYFVDPDAVPFNELLTQIRGGREERNRLILRKLNDLGLSLTWEEVASRAGDEVVGRPHFAQAMIDRQYVKDKYEAFDNFLGKGKAAYVDRLRFSPELTVNAIVDAGGVPVLAHPKTLRLDRSSLRGLLEKLCAVGLRGIEALYAEHNPSEQAEYLAMAGDFGLVATGGTDFHGLATPGVRMGRGLGTLDIPDEIVPRLEACRPGQT